MEVYSHSTSTIWRASLMGAIGACMLAALSMLPSSYARSIAFAQQPCNNVYSWGLALSGTGSTNKGTLGVVAIPVSTNQPNQGPFPFIAQSVWIARPTAMSSFSTEGGAAYGFTKSTNTFISHWYYYRTLWNGSYEEADGYGTLSPGVQYLIAAWFYTSGNTYVNFYGAPYWGGSPVWAPPAFALFPWIGSDWRNHSQGETNSTCSTWFYAQWNGLKWTDGVGWYPWGTMGVSQQGSGPPVQIGAQSLTDYFNYR